MIQMHSLEATVFFSSCSGTPSSNFNKLRYKTKSIDQHRFDLCKAAIMGDSARVLTLLACGTPVDYNIGKNWRYSMPHGYNRMPAPAWGALPLIHLVAMIANNTDILESIINAGGNVHVTHELTYSGGYPTSGSILHNTLNLHTNLPVFEVLINAGADVKSTNSKGISVVTALLTTEAFNRFTGPDGYQSEARDEKIALLKLFVKNGATLNADDVDLLFKLITKKTISDPDIEQLTLCLDNNISLSGANGSKILHYIANHLKIDSPAKTIFVERAINSGINLNEQDQQGRTALHLAALNNNPTLIELLLRQADDTGKIKVDINSADTDGVTPLHFAAKTSVQCLNILLALVDSDAKILADVNHADKDGRTPLHCAIFNEECVTQLLKHVVTIDTADLLGNTAVHCAANKPSLKILLQHGAKSDMPNNEGITPLMYALQSEALISASALLNAGANIWAKTHDGRTMLDFAILNPHTLAYVQAEMTRQQHELSEKLAQKLQLA